MLKLELFGARLAGASLLALAPTVWGATGPADVRTYQTEAGTSFYAASLSLDAATAKAANTGAREVVLLVDTSASQTGMFRETALSAVKACLAQLQPTDRVQIIACDLEARPLTKSAVAPNSAEAAAALAALERESPLGSTDMPGVLKAVAERFSTDSAQRSIVYVGDGVSTANVLGTDSFEELVGKLRAAKIAVSSYAVGPQCDAALLAALANQSGGNLYIDDGMVLADEREEISLERATEENLRRGAQVGRTLADWAEAAVVWPSAAELGAGVTNMYPAELPPLRSDRETVVIGQLAANHTGPIALAATTSSGKLDWKATTAEPNDAHAYLANLVERASEDRGLSLTTLGTAGLEETGRLVNTEVDRMTDLAERAIATGDRESAAKIAQAVLRREPGNVRALTVQQVVSKPAQPGANVMRLAQAEVLPGEAVIPGEASIMEEQIAPGDTVESDLIMAPAQAPPAAGPPAGEFAAPSLLENFDSVVGEQYPSTDIVADSEMLDSVERQNRIFAQMLEKETQNAIAQARDKFASEPTIAMQDLKLALENVRRAPELLADVRASLTDRLESALREASRAATYKDSIDREREEAVAASRERKLLLDRMELQRQREKQLVDRFNALIDERRYQEAEEVAEILAEVDPNGVTPVVARLYAQHRQYDDLNMAVRRAKSAAFVETMYQVETSAIPFSDENPVIYPDAAWWEEMTNRRKKYAAVDLKAQGGNEEKINAALDSPLSSQGLEFTETPLEEVINLLREEYNIEIQLDDPALDDLGIDSTEPVNVSLRNISLRSALRIMLKKLDLTYVIEDEVLLITTTEEAETRLSVRVYPVADLVIPIQTPQVSGLGGLGGGGQGGGGGGLGGGGGGGLGGGGGGGGFGGGGGGFGGGGGGGQFAVPDDAADLTLTNAKAPANVQPAQKSAPAKPQAAVSKSSTTKVTPIAVDFKADPQRFWDSYFAQGEVDGAAVRQAARDLMKTGRYNSVVALVQAALRHSQPQPWMYESLGIAMQLDGRPAAEVERALMSAVDFTRSPEQLLLIGQYLSKSGFEKRALQVFQQIVKIDPLQQEVYVLGLRSAQRLDDVAGIRWATIGILNQAWPKQQAAIEDTARRLALATIERLNKANDSATAEAFAAELKTAQQRDCVIRVSWTGDADIDVAVQEPGGSICSSLEPRSIGGGVTLGDTFAVDKNAAPDITEATAGYSETYVCPRAFSGDYRLAIRRVWGQVTANTVTVDVYLNYGTPEMQHQREQIQLSGEDAEGDSVVKFALNTGRRTEPLDAQVVATAAQRQQAVSQAVLAQQLGGLTDPGSVPLAPNDPRRRGLPLLPAQGAVGFQPVIITLPEGTNLIATAVVSADRRYVRITSVPFFSTVGNVSTFTFSGAAVTNGDGDGQGGGDGNAGGGDGGNAGGGGGAIVP